MSTTSVEQIKSMALWNTPAGRTHPELVSTGSGRQDWQQLLTAIGNELEQADEQGKAQLRHRLGYISMVLGDSRTKAIEAFTMMLDSAVALQDKRLEAMAKIGLSLAYDTIGQRHDSLRLANEAIRLAEEMDDRRLLALALNSQAQFYKENGENERAHQLFERVQQIGRELDDEELVMGSYIGLGRSTSMAEAEKATAHYEEAIALAQARQDERALIICYNNLSDWKINLGLYDEAIVLRQESLRLSQKLGMRVGIGRAYIGMAKAYTLMGQTDKAGEMINKGFPVAIRASDLEGDLHASLNLAYLYAQNGDIPRASEVYRSVLDRSLAAPDHACAIFAQKALEVLADGEIPPPGVLLGRPMTGDAFELTNEELAGVVGGINNGPVFLYPTGDMDWN